jgi:hypothetical protein
LKRLVSFWNAQECIGEHHELQRLYGSD